MWTKSICCDVIQVDRVWTREAVSSVSVRRVSRAAAVRSTVTSVPSTRASTAAVASTDRTTSSAAALLGTSERCANMTSTNASPDRVPTAVPARNSWTTSGARARRDSPVDSARRTSTSVGRRLVATTALASTRREASTAAVRPASRACSVKSIFCPSTPPDAILDRPSPSRAERRWYEFSLRCRQGRRHLEAARRSAVGAVTRCRVSSRCCSLPRSGSLFRSSSSPAPSPSGSIVDGGVDASVPPPWLPQSVPSRDWTTSDRRRRRHHD